MFIPTKDEIKLALDLNASSADRAKLFPLIHILISFAAMIVGVLHWKENGPWQIILVQSFVAFIFLISSFIYSKPKRFNWPYLTLPFIAAMIHIPYKFYSYGVILNSAPIYLIMAPLFATFIFNYKVGLTFNLIYLIELITIAVFIKNGTPFTMLELGYMTAIFLTMTITQVFMIIYEFSRNNWRDMIQKSHQHTLSHSNITTIGQMTGNLAHNINNPLSIIFGFVNKLTKVVSDPVQLNYLVKIEDASVRIRQTTNYLIELSSTDIGEQNHELYKTIHTFESFAKDQLQLSTLNFLGFEESKTINFFGNKAALFRILVSTFYLFKHQKLSDGEIQSSIQLEKTKSLLNITITIFSRSMNIKDCMISEKEFSLNWEVIEAIADSFSIPLNSKIESNRFHLRLVLKRS